MPLRVGLFPSLLVLSTIALSMPMPSSAQSISSALTVGQFIQGLEDLDKRLENSGHSLIEQGNAVAGQQQLLLAGSLEALTAQLTRAYSSSMNETFDRLDKSQADAFKNVALSLKGATSIEHDTASDIFKLQTDTQSSIHQLLDRIPLTDKSPLYFGIQTRDVLSAYDPHPDDIVIRGYHLVDKDLDNRPPDIALLLDGKIYNIEAKRLSAQFDRINIALPDDIRKAIKLENKPCDPMKLFHISGRVYYMSSWFNTGLIKTQRTFPFEADAESGMRLYQISSKANFEETSVQPTPASFITVSGQVNFGCEETRSLTVQWNVPEGATQLNAAADWINTDNVKSHSQQALTSGLTATASGSITGLDKSIGFLGVSNCPGGGHGALRLSGSYMLPQAVKRDDTDNKSTVIHPGDTVHLTMPSGSQIKMKMLHLSMARLGCTQTLDELEMLIPEDQRIVQATSKQGYFEATAHPGQIDLQNTKIVP